MKNRYLVDVLPPEGSPALLREEEFHHAARVHRVRVGDRVEIFDGLGNASDAVVEALQKDHVLLTVQGKLPDRELPARVVLAVALIQPEKFELVLQKGTELGVSEFLPLLTDRVELRVERVLGKHDRWEKIIREATKQCGRAKFPTLSTPIDFDVALQRSEEKLLLDADGDAPLGSGDGATLLMIGPEGGWSEEELRRAREGGVRFCRMGPRRLRAETAAITAAALVAAGIERAE